MSNKESDDGQQGDPIAAEASADARVAASSVPPTEGETALVKAEKRPLTRAEKKAAKRAAKQAVAAKRAEEAALEKKLPRLNALLKEVHFKYDDRISWLRRFDAGSVTEDEIVSIVAPTADARKNGMRRRVAIARHGIARWIRNPNSLWAAGFTVSWSYLLIKCLNQLHWRFWAILSAGTIVLGKLRYVIQSIRSRYMQLVTRGYNERKIALEALLETSQRWYATPPSEDQVDQFRREALQLVANYVHDQRGKFGGREIWANLLVRRGDQIVVVGRSDPRRPTPKSYPRAQCLLVWNAIETGEAQLTGDLYSDFPTTTPGKKYFSVLVLPVRFRGTVLGAVSIDSPETFHFHLNFDDLQVQLSPYVQLLAVTLLDAHDTGRKSLPPVRHP